MAATKYQVLYRYINETINKVITNLEVENVDVIFKYYNTAESAEIDEQINEMTAESLLATNPKYNTFFAYVGTKNTKEQGNYPRVIHDVYVQIPMSPWFVNATYGSLDAALTRAQTLVNMIGIENVKLIKVVPYGQFIDIE